MAIIENKTSKWLAILSYEVIGIVQPIVEGILTSYFIIWKTGFGLWTKLLKTIVIVA